MAFLNAATSALESAGSVNLRVNLSEPTNVTVTVKFVVTGGTAAGNGTDYDLANGTLMFEPQQTVKFLLLILANDSLDEVNETVVLDLSEATNAARGSVTNTTLTILDDDPAPSVAFASAASSGSEANTSVNVTVILSTASGQTVSAIYNVTQGNVKQTAMPGLIFTPGQTSRSIRITVVDDDVPETNETIVVELVEATNASLGSPSTYTYTIQDNDS